MAHSLHISTVVVFGLLVLGAPPGVADTFYVNRDTGNDGWNGRCETYQQGDCGPKATIQGGIDVASNGDTVIVADSPNEYVGPDNRDLDFSQNLPPGQTRAITVRSQGGNPLNCVINSEDSGRAFWFHSGETATSVVRGFTMTNGYVSPGYGGAILCENGSSPKIINCNFSANEVEPSGMSDPAGGGAIACLSGESAGSSPVIANCSFSGNTALKSGAPYGQPAPGGAIYCGAPPYIDAHSNPVIVNCTFTDNSATDAGGAIYLSASNPILMRCEIKGNRSMVVGYGRAVYCTASSPTIVNCLIAENDDYPPANPTWYGGAIACDSGSNAILTNCTIADNLATAGWNDQGGGLLCADSAPVLTNCILWANTDPQIEATYGAPMVTYSDVQGGWTGQGHNNMDPPVYPEFVIGAYWGANDHHYLSHNGVNGQTVDSPCLNVGSGLAIDIGLRYATTRTDLVGDGAGPSPDEWVDLGFHYPRDCLPNGIPDPEEIADGSATDCNYNGVPDACENGGAPDDCGAVPNRGAFTDEGTFNEGTLINVYYDPVGHALKRNVVARPLPFIWVPTSWDSGLGRGTVLRICTEDVQDVGSKGTILGEYRTAPHNPSGANPSPSRTAVDLDGNVWVANRADNDGNTNTGSVTRVGLVIGGVRCDASGTPNEFGEYLKATPLAPLRYNTCVDRNGDGLIRTSRGTIGWTNEDPPRPLLHTLAWLGPQYGSVATAEDECIINYVRVDGTGTRHLSINAKNDLWVGGWEYDHAHWFDLVDGVSATINPNLTFHTMPTGLGGYAGLTDCAGVLWSVEQASGLLRYVPDYEWPYDPSWSFRESTGSYGLGIDYQGNLWNSLWVDPGGNGVRKFTPDGTSWWSFPTAGGTHNRGVAVTVDESFASHIWIANSDDGHKVTRLTGSGDWRATVELTGDEPDDGKGPTGAAVDKAGKVWVTCLNGHTVKCIDPASNAVDKTVRLPDSAYPYSCSDMTGQVTLQTSATGTWNVIHDGGKFGARWHLVLWNREEGCGNLPPGLTVGVRAADLQTALASQGFLTVEDGKRFPDPDNIQGRYIEVRVRFKGECPPSQTVPVLCDLTVTFGLGDMNCDGVLDFADIDAFVLALSDPAAYQAAYPDCDIMLADINSDGLVDFADIDPFVALLSG